MRKLVPALALGALLVGFGAGPAFAQSSGNFTAQVTTSACAINPMSGNLSINGMTPGTGGTFTATIKLPGSSPALLIDPSLATGLFTMTTAMGNSTPATADGAIVVSVTDKFNNVTTPVAPNTTCVDTNMPPTGCSPSSPGPGCVCGVIYDQRFQQMTFNDTSTSSIQLIQSTLTAHSFNFVEPTTAQQGQHVITATWAFGCPDAMGNLATANCTGNEAACVGPGALTVQQVQTFEGDSSISITP